MSHSIFGWDLPPGCRVSDIPGNRPEDEEWEKITEGFWDGKHCSDEVYHKFEKAKLDNDLIDIVDKAIEYGMGIGQKEADTCRQENQYYESRFVEEILEKDKVPQVTIDKVIHIIKGDYETL